MSKSLFVKRFIFLLVVIYLFSSCEKKEISNLPFEVTKNISCNDLYENDFRWIFGIDVDLMGKKNNNVEIVYNLDSFRKNRGNNDETIINSKIDTVLSRKYYNIYKDKNWLEVPDSIYSIIWGEKEFLKRIHCKNSYVYGRGYNISLKENEIRNIKNTIDTIKYKVFDINSNHETTYQIETFKVLNRIKKDTFHCFTYKDNEGKYYFSTAIQFREYE